MSLWLTSLILVWASVTSHAVVLKPVPAPPGQRLPIDENAPDYKCSEILAKLQAYATMASDHNQSVNAFLGQVSEKVTGWYSELQPLEGTQQTLAPDTFLPLQDGAQKISDITNLAFDNSALLAGEMDRILTSMQKCTLRANRK